MGYAIDVSEDHKPDLASERDRIIRAGGYIEYSGSVARAHLPRELYSTAFSRSFGDFGYKRDHESPFDHAVICIPDHFVLRRSPEDCFLILASDGLWDEIAYSQLVRFLDPKIDPQETHERVKDLVRFMAYDHVRPDDITVVVLDLRNADGAS